MEQLHLWSQISEGTGARGQENVNLTFVDLDTCSLQLHEHHLLNS